MLKPLTARQLAHLRACAALAARLAAQPVSDEEQRRHEELPL